MKTEKIKQAENRLMSRAGIPIKFVGLRIWWILSVEAPLRQLKYNLLRVLLCKRGYHRLTVGYHKYENSKGVHLSSKYLHCPVCETYFFTSKAQKSQFKRINEGTSALFGNYLKAKFGVKPKGNAPAKVKTFGEV